MFVGNYELLFPPRVVPTLRNLRGDLWQKLIDQTSRQEPDAPEWVTFVLMMARLSSCATCHSGSYRALKGCEQCAQQVVQRFEGTDSEFIDLFQKTREEIDQFFARKEIEV